MRLRKGFPLELVAAEPLVIDTIAFAFDEDGELFVVEMKDYPDRKQHSGRISRLVDTDGDGCFDMATVFAKDLRWRHLRLFRARSFYFKDTTTTASPTKRKFTSTGPKTQNQPASAKENTAASAPTSNTSSKKTNLGEIIASGFRTGIMKPGEVQTLSVNFVDPIQTTITEDSS